MGKVGSLYVTIGAKLLGLEGDLKNAHQLVDKAAQKIQSRLDSINFGRWALGATAALTGTSVGVGALAASFQQAATTAEQYAVRLKVVTGSTREANQLFKDMAEFAAKVPYEYEEIMGAATQMAAIMKGNTAEVRRWMPLIADLAAATGLGIQETTGQILRMYSAGAASADLFRERGISAMLGFKYGVTYSAEETRKKLMQAWQGMGSNFKGATSELAKTWVGMTSNLADHWFAFRTKVMDSGIFLYMKTGVKMVLDAVDELKESGKMQEWADELATKVLNAMKRITLGAAHVYDFIAPIVKDIAGLMGDVWDAFQKLPQWVQEVGVVAAFLGGKRIAVTVAALAMLYEEAKNVYEGMKQWSSADFEAATGNIGQPTAVEKKIDAIGDASSRAATNFQELLQKMGGAKNATEAVKILWASLDKMVSSQKAAAQATGETGRKLVQQAEAAEVDKKALEKARKELEKLKDAQIDAINEVGEFVNQQKWLDPDEIEMLYRAANNAEKENVEQLKSYFKERNDLREDAIEKQKSVEEKMAADSQDTFDDMASFYREALSTMGDDTSSFVEMIKSKLKNLAATIVSDVMATLSIQLLGGLAKLSGGTIMSSGSGAGGLNSIAMGGGGSLGGRNFGAMDLLSAGKMGTSLFGKNPTFMGINMSPTTITGFQSLPEGVMGPPAPIYGANWMAGGLGAAGAIAGGYGVYNAYKTAQSPGQGLAMGGISGAAGGYGAGVAASAAATALAGAEMGSAWPVVGTIIGAIVGGIVGMLGGGSNKAKAQRMKRAETYGTQLERASEFEVTDQTGWDAWLVGSKNLLTDKNAYAFQKYGGVNAGDNLFKMGEISREYKQAIDNYGDSSSAAIASLSRMEMHMRKFSASSKAWGKDGQTVAQAWEQIVEKTKRVQINEVIDDMNRGIGTFSNNLAKLDLIEFDEGEKAAIKYNQALKFLASDALPAVYGELSRVRETLREAKDEMEKLAREEESAGLKAQILASDIELTEEQLQALRFKDVNVELVHLYQALGWADKEINLLADDSGELKDVFDMIVDLGSSANDALGEITETIMQIKDLPPELAKVHAVLVDIVTAIEVIGKAGQLVSGVPDIFERMVDALKAGDIQAFNQELYKLSTTILELAAAMDRLNFSTATMNATNAAAGATTAATAPATATVGGIQLGGQAAEFLLDLRNVFVVLGEIGMVVYVIIEGFLLLQTIIQKSMQYLTEEFPDFKDAVLDFLADVERWMPKLAEYWRKVWLIPEDEIKTTLRDALGLGKMDIGGVAGLIQRYKGSGDNEQEQIAAIRETFDAAKSVMDEEIAALAQRLGEDGRMTVSETAEWIEAMEAYAEALGILREGVEDDIQAIRDAAAESRQQALAPVNQMASDFARIIKSMGQTSTQMQFYDIGSWMNDTVREIQKFYTSGLINKYQYEDLMEKAIISARAKIQIIKRQIYESVIQPVIDYLATRKMGELEKSIADLGKQFINLSNEALAAGLSTATLVVGYKAQREELINNYWKPVMEAIKGDIAGLIGSKYNLGTPIQKASAAGQTYNELRDALKTAKGEDFKTAYEKFKAFYGSYLDEMQNTYKSSITYLTAYNDVMSTLQQAETRATEEMNIQLASIDQQILDSIRNGNIALSGTVGNLGATLTNTNTIIQNIADMLAQWKRENGLSSGTSSSSGSSGGGSSGGGKSTSQSEDVVFVSGGPHYHGAGNTGNGKKISNSSGLGYRIVDGGFVITL